MSNRIEPVELGGTDTLLSATKANQCIAAANMWLTARGLNGVKVHKADAGFVIEGDGEGTCPTPQIFQYTVIIVYGITCLPTAPPSQQFDDEQEWAVDDFITLYDYFPYRTFHDGICPLGPGEPGRVDRLHPDTASITMGPYAGDRIIFNPTEIWADDSLRLDGTPIAVTNFPTAAGTAFMLLPKGDSATITLVDQGGAHVWAVGHIAAIRPRCATQSLRDQLGL